MVLIYGHCWECERAIQISVGQYISNQELVWYRSQNCPYCGNQLEEDGAGIPPEEIRQAILAIEGQYNLIVQETGSRAVVAIKLLRAALDLSLNEAMKLKSMMPGKTISGTKVEMERLLSFLISEELNAWSEQSKKI